MPYTDEDLVGYRTMEERVTPIIAELTFDGQSNISNLLKAAKGDGCCVKKIVHSRDVEQMQDRSSSGRAILVLCNPSHLLNHSKEMLYLPPPRCKSSCTLSGQDSTAYSKLPSSSDSLRQKTSGSA